MIPKHPVFFSYLFLVTACCISAQQFPTVQIASLRPEPQLHWRRVSPTALQPEGPVLYQIIFRSSATVNHIPRVSNGQLVDSLITDDGSQVRIGNLAIDRNGFITFANGQQFPATVTSVTAGDGSIAIAGSGTVPLITVAGNGITNAHIALGALSPAKIAGTAAILNGSNTFTGDQAIFGDLFLVNSSFAGQMRIGDVGCGSFFAGLDMTPPGGAFTNCSTYALRSDGTDTFVNRPSGGTLHFRVGNVDSMFIAHGGNVISNITVVKAMGGFKIDHPVDAANKYLYHSFVESPDMMNVYNGRVTLDANGEAVVTLPGWFGALNRDFRYELTAIGTPGPNLYVAEEISNNRFKIAGGAPRGKVSWLVTGIRQDAYANAHRIPVEVDKPAAEKGTYLHPELFGTPPEKSTAVGQPGLTVAPSSAQF